MNLHPLVSYENRFPELQISASLQLFNENSVEFIYNVRSRAQKNSSDENQSDENPDGSAKKLTSLDRKHDLWKKNCFEAFLSFQSEEPYLEFNFSPEGFWNVYHFDSYRTGMKEFTEIQEVTVKKNQTKKDQDNYHFIVSFDLREGLWLASLNAVYGPRNTYDHWALKKIEGQPDFHRKESRIIQMEKD